MARLNVNSTRMELSRLKTKLGSARRGHKLLKDKRDELLRRFAGLEEETEATRQLCNIKIETAMREIALARANLKKEGIGSALLPLGKKAKLDVSSERIMGVEVPAFRLKTVKNSISYGFAFTDSHLDDAVESLFSVQDELVKLAECEKKLLLIKKELESANRRVNALEYILIPDFEETIRYIVMKLDEQERSGITRLMKVKNMVPKKSEVSGNP